MATSALADLRSKPLATRGEILCAVTPSLPDTTRFSETFDVSVADLMAAVCSSGSEGVVQTGATAYVTREIIPETGAKVAAVFRRNAQLPLQRLQR